MFQRELQPDTAVARPQTGGGFAVIVPTYAETDELVRLYEQLETMAEIEQVIVADATPAGDGRATVDALRGRSVASAQSQRPRMRVMMDCPRGRAAQMNYGVTQIEGDVDVVAFVHADSILPNGFSGFVTTALSNGYRWGRFDIQLDGREWPLRLVEKMMNLRSRYTGICTGDQCLFVHREAFESVGGFPEQPLMEDIEISRRLKRRFGRPAALREAITTSARRWQLNGPWRTIVLMWRLRFLYAIGVSPERLSAIYANTRRGS